MLGLKRGTVALFPHEKEWETEAQRTIEKLKSICGDVIVDIAHVGSTSVKSIMAKPIIDIAASVNDFDEVLAIDEKLKKSFDELCNEIGLSNSAAVTIFMKAAVREQRIPFELRTESEEEIRAKGLAAFHKLRAIAQENGIAGMSLDEINEEIRLARRGE